MSLKNYIKETTELLVDLGSSTDFWWICLAISLIGLMIMCLPTPPTIILGAAILVLPYVAYGFAWVAVGVASLIDYCTDKFADWKNARNGYARFEADLAYADEAQFATSPLYQQNTTNADEIPDIGSAVRYGSPIDASSHGNGVSDFNYEPAKYVK